MPKKVIFYSWQSDLPNATNRGFIERALEQALAASSTHRDSELDPVIDRDTLGVPGAPDIAAVIFAKIENADVFVADISLIPSEGQRRPTPNPNVLIELGYALKALGPEKVVLVFNEAFGRLDQLPFDLQRKRVITYSAAEESENRAAERKVLVSKLRVQIDTVLDFDRSQQATALITHAINEVGWQLINVLIYASEAQERHLKPWIDNEKAILDRDKDRIRRFAAHPVANALGISELLHELASQIERVVNHRAATGLTNWTEYKEKVAAAKEVAQVIFDRLIGSRPLGPNLLAQFRNDVQTYLNLLDDLSRRAEVAILEQAWQFVPQAQKEAARIGRALLNLSYYNLDQIATGLSGEIRAIGRDLHLLETSKQHGDGGASSREILERLIAAANKTSVLRQVVK